MTIAVPLARPRQPIASRNSPVANPSILILAGDGIGPEVMAEVKKIIGWYDAKRGIIFDVSEGLVGGCSYDAHGTPLTDATMAQAQAVDCAARCR